MKVIVVVGSEKWVDVCAVEQVLEGAHSVITTDAPGAAAIAIGGVAKGLVPSATLFNVEVPGVYKSILRHAVEAVALQGADVRVHVFVVGGEPGYALHDFAVSAMLRLLPVQIHAGCSLPEGGFVVTA